MAMGLGKIAILAGAGIIGSVLASEGRMSNVSDFISVTLKIAFKTLQGGDSKSTSSARKPHDSIKDQVDIIKRELQTMRSSGPITIVSGSGKGSSRYVIVIVIGVVGYGYLWWKGWKLPDMMFATRRSLSEACTSIAQQLENVYSSIRTTRRELSSSIDNVDTNLNEVAQLTANTQGRVTDLLQESERIGHDVRYVLDVVETLELKISEIEGKQNLTVQGVQALCEVADELQNNARKENIQVLQSSSLITFSPKVASLPPPSPEPSTPSVSNGSLETSNGISGVVEASSNPGTSHDFHIPEVASNGSSTVQRPPFLQRARSVTSSVLHRVGSNRQYAQR
ncbi:hypothetical protein K2173_006693 [Erythroxylum novogranatense]|uniref:DUF1664 domain-containing protein n=1 Tax=Erythroxylum novogranatense TaxID=1862640 RepID=A0AAV8SZ05_9ROSI|nr:hypothetical protein K2173_006693 [Erythroxylum novogranatense]